MAALLGELGDLTPKDDVQENISPSQIEQLDVIPDSPDHATIKSRGPSVSAESGKTESQGKTENQGKTETNGKTEIQGKAKFEGKTEGDIPDFEGKTEGKNAKFEGKTQGKNTKFEGKTDH